MKKKNLNAQGGYIAILAVLMIVAVGVMVVSTMSLLGIGEVQSSVSLMKGENTLDFVEGCTEDALLKVRANIGYAGGTITRPEGTCSVVVAKNGNVWTLTVTTTDVTYARTVQVVGTRNITTFTISTWKEI